MKEEQDFDTLAGRLRDSLGALAEAVPERAEMFAANAPAAAVLIPLVMHPAGASVLFTRRSEQLRHHAGQISFPGGRVEADDPSVEHAALRETREEVGIAPGEVAVLRRLAPVHVPSGFVIYPVLGLLKAPLIVTPDPGEVAQVFEVPLAHLVRPQQYQTHRMMRPGGEFKLDAIAYQGYFIWGATARILIGARPCLEAMLRVF